MRWQAGDVRAVEKDPPDFGREHARDLADERRLAGAVRPDERMHLAADDVERDVVGRDHAAEALGDGAQLKHGAFLPPDRRGLRARA